MFFPWCELHTHTTRSDGRLTPIELVRKAYAAGIRVLSITDHNYTELHIRCQGLVVCHFAVYSPVVHNRST